MGMGQVESVGIPLFFFTSQLIPTAYVATKTAVD